jgi:hypothetical protein
VVVAVTAFAGLFVIPAADAGLGVPFDTPGPFTQAVPDGTCTADVVVIGGSGGGQSGSDYKGGPGGQVTATIPVVAGTELTGIVGGNGGGDASSTGGGGGVGGGGTAGNAGGVAGFGGGGRSEILDASNNPLVVAGGGGGESGGFVRGGAGTGGIAFTVATGTGQNGSDGQDGTFADSGGRGGGGSGGGGGGVGVPSASNGNAGSAGTGGNSSFAFGVGRSGGAGGGGYFGGGGGGGTNAGVLVSGGGGGGSSFVVNGSTGIIYGTSTAGGSVSITFVPCPPTTPDAPQSVAVAAAGSGNAKLTFMPPADDGGAAIDLYKAACVASGHTTQTASGASSPLTVSGLTNGAVYRCAVRAHNKVGDGPNAGGFVRVGVPGAPGKASASKGAKAGSLKISFGAAVATASPVTAYAVVCTPPSGPSVSALATGSPRTMHGLTRTKQYACKVAARNQFGFGPYGGSSALMLPT